MGPALHDVTTRRRVALIGMCTAALAVLAPLLFLTAVDSSAAISLAVVTLVLAALVRLEGHGAEPRCPRGGHGVPDRRRDATGSDRADHRPRPPPAPPTRSWNGLTLASSEPTACSSPSLQEHFMSVLDPLSHALANVVATAHAGLTSLGADPVSGTTWLLCIAAVVVVVRLAAAPVGSPRRPSGPCLRAGTTAAAGAHQALPQPQGPREHAGTHARATSHRGRAQDAATGLPAAAGAAAHLVGAVPPARRGRGRCFRSAR